MKFLDRFRKDKSAPGDAVAAPDQSVPATASVEERAAPAEESAPAKESAPAPEPVADADADASARPGFFARLRGGAETAEAVDAPPAVEEQKKPGLFARLKAGLRRTGSSFSEGIGNLFLGKKEIDDELLEELETRLLMADVGIDATQQIIGNLTKRVSRKELADAQALYTALQDELK
jgi:fused signal recognition particle receptor